MKPDRAPREIKSLNVRSTPWKGLCTSSCWSSRGKRCRCKCKGVYHGAGHYGRKTDLTEYIVGSELAAPGRVQLK